MGARRSGSAHFVCLAFQVEEITLVASCFLMARLSRTAQLTPAAGLRMARYLKAFNISLFFPPSIAIARGCKASMLYPEEQDLCIEDSQCTSFLDPSCKTHL